jgi:hypothetical protein
MNKKLRVFLFALILLGVPLLFFSTYKITNETVYYYKHGIPKNALVVKKISADVSPVTNQVTYTYQIDIDGSQIISEFPYEFAKGDRISVLVSPDDPNSVAMGKVDDNLLTLIEYQLGNKFFAYFGLVLFPMLFLYSPKMLYDLIYHPENLLKKQ